MKRKGCFFLCAVLFLAAFFGSGAVAQEGCILCGNFLAAGFPRDYARSLCALKGEHPQWNFVPLDIGRLARDKGMEYDFSFVVESEIQVRERSLVAPSPRYAPYRHGGGEVFDSGYYRASREAVAFFLDPRNHLSEKAVFQFLDLSRGVEKGEEILSFALSGTAAEKVFSPEEILSAARQTGVDALHLAVRLRQEQGEKGNNLLWGNTGSILLDWYENGVQREGERLILAPSRGLEKNELLSLDGIYNPLNISAKGEGVFAIFLSGARHGREKGWTTPLKGLLGGAEKIAREYIASFQNTLYLQKWNVDPRSVTETGQTRNFWGQYMQNISGALTEAAILFDQYEKASLLEEKLNFLIPVYEEMPAFPSPDPAEGKVEEFAAKYLSSPHLFPEEEALSLAPSPLPAAPGETLPSMKEGKEMGRDSIWFFTGISALFLLLFHRASVLLFASIRQKRRRFYEK